MKGKLRQTDADWQFVGKSNPYWGVLSEERFLARNITSASLTELYLSGETHIDQTLRRAHRSFSCIPLLNRALDFGCGVGRLTNAMAGHAEMVVGYDVSPAMILKANITAAHNTEFTTSWPVGNFNWINSFIVFQHIPPRRGLALLSQLVSLLDTSSLITLHFTIFRDKSLQPSRSLRARVGGPIKRLMGLGWQPPLGSIMMYDYNLNDIMEILFIAGFQNNMLFHSNHDGHHGVEIIGVREG